MSRTAIVAISRRGVDLARRLQRSLEGSPDLYLDRRFWIAEDNAQYFDLPLRPVVARVLSQYQAVILFLPVGAAVRLIAPYLQDKRQDPAVVSVDDSGRFAVSLVSGHVGGADQLAAEVARALRATPVITSGSHVTETLAIDLLGREFGWRLEADPVAVTRASAVVVNGDPVGICQMAGEAHWWPEDRPMPGNLTIYHSLATLGASGCAAALVISVESDPLAGELGADRKDLGDRILILYRPRTLIAGMGCRRGVPMAELEHLLKLTFQENNLSLSSLDCIATADLKQSEPGLQALAQKYGVPLVSYSGDQLNAVFSPASLEPRGLRSSPVEPVGKASGLTPSVKAHSLLGIWGVSEPAAILASGSNSLLVSKQKGARATVAVARKTF